ncbi:MAG TPA: sterol carrier protein domain-containing protein, partial [Rubrobacter sp.]|nr:sterol carrier protein domain-containing protein [Rubrobacter sp.]
RAERKDDGADVELSANFVAPLFTGYVTPETAARTGMMRVLRPEALEDMTRALAVTDIPYSQDFY